MYLSFRSAVGLGKLVVPWDCTKGRMICGDVVNSTHSIKS